MAETVETERGDTALLEELSQGLVAGAVLVGQKAMAEHRDRVGGVLRFGEHGRNPVSGLITK